MLAVEIKGLTKQIKDSVVLDHIDLALEEGGIYGFYGPNGSGKTMLFRTVAGIVHPTEGTVKCFGKELGKDVSFPEEMGLIIENVGFWKDFTGFENMKMLASIRKKISDQEIRDTLTRVGLDPQDKRSYGKYSLGMKQRLAIAQAIMEKPRLLILDEPTNALDYDGIAEVHKIIRQERDRGATALIASHNQEDLTNLCDGFYQFQEGGKLRKTEGIVLGGDQK